jgi:hypothetical protein
MSSTLRTTASSFGALTSCGLSVFIPPNPVHKWCSRWFSVSQLDAVWPGPRVQLALGCPPAVLPLAPCAIVALPLAPVVLRLCSRWPPLCSHRAPVVPRALPLCSRWPPSCSRCAPVGHRCTPVALPLAPVVLPLASPLASPSVGLLAGVLVIIL